MVGRLCDRVLRGRRHSHAHLLLGGRTEEIQWVPRGCYYLRLHLTSKLSTYTGSRACTCVCVLFMKPASKVTHLISSRLVLVGLGSTCVSDRKTWSRDFESLCEFAFRQFQGEGEGVLFAPPIRVRSGLKMIGADLLRRDPKREFARGGRSFVAKYRFAYWLSRAGDIRLSSDFEPGQVAKWRVTFCARDHELPPGCTAEALRRESLDIAYGIFFCESCALTHRY